MKHSRTRLRNLRRPAAANLVQKIHGVDVAAYVIHFVFTARLLHHGLSILLCFGEGTIKAIENVVNFSREHRPIRLQPCEGTVESGVFHRRATLSVVWFICGVQGIGSNMVEVGGIPDLVWAISRRRPNRLSRLFTSISKILRIFGDIHHVMLLSDPIKGCGQIIILSS